MVDVGNIRPYLEDFSPGRGFLAQPSHFQQFHSDQAFRYGLYIYFHIVCDYGMLI